MLETRADNSGDVEMADVAFISPSSSPGQPAGVVLPLTPSSAAVVSHPSPPPTPSCSPNRQDTPSTASVKLEDDHHHHHSRMSLIPHHGPPQCGETQHECPQSYRGFSPSGHHRFRTGGVTDKDSLLTNDTDCGGVAGSRGDAVIDVTSCDDVSDGEEVIDVIGDDDMTDVASSSTTSDCDTRKDSSCGGSDVGSSPEDESKGRGGNDNDNNNHKTDSPLREVSSDEQSDSGSSRHQESPSSVTNFSIAAILKPDFGPARKLQWDTHSPRASSIPYPHPHRHSNNDNNTNTTTNANSIKTSFGNFHSRFLTLPHHTSHHHHHHRQQQHHHHHSHHYHHQQQQQKQQLQQQQQQQQHLHAQQLLHQRLSPSSPAAPVDLSTRGRTSLVHHVQTKDFAKRTDCKDFLSNSRQYGNVTSSANSVDNKAGGKNVGNNVADGKPKKTGTSSSSASAASSSATGGKNTDLNPDNKHLWPAWVFCTRYSDRPSSGPRSRRMKRKERSSVTVEEKRPRTAFTSDQLSRLKREFDDCRYLTETRRRSLASELGLSESQIKIWFQNKRAKLKKSSGVKNELALQLMAQGLYNHSTVPVEGEAGALGAELLDEERGDDDDEVRRREAGNDGRVC